MISTTAKLGDDDDDDDGDGDDDNDDGVPKSLRFKIVPRLKKEARLCPAAA